jgi:hypothetical protein
LQSVIKYCQNGCKKIEENIAYKDIEKEVKEDISSVLTFRTPAGTIIFCKNSSCPNSIVSLLNDYDKLLASSINSSNSFLVTNVHFDNSQEPMK